MPMDVLFPPGRKIERNVERVKKTLHPFDALSSLKKTHSMVDLGEIIARTTELVFSLPAV